MATDNNHDNDRIDRIEAAIISLTETQRQLVESAQRHDIEMEMLRAIQRDVAATQQRQDATQERLAATQERLAANQQDQAAAIQRHEDILQILAEGQRRLAAAMEEYAASNNQLVNLIQTVTTTLHGVIGTQQEHSNDIRDLRENRDNAP